MNNQWKEECLRELQRGNLAREAGNEGMARVCARRAAGVIIREYFRRNGDDPGNLSVLNLLKRLSQSTNISPRIREIASHFVWQITVDHKLPEDVDLLAEARWMLAELLGEKAEKGGNQHQN